MSKCIPEADLLHFVYYSPLLDDTHSPVGLIFSTLKSCSATLPILITMQLLTFHAHSLPDYSIRKGNVSKEGYGGI